MKITRLAALAVSALVLACCPAVAAAGMGPDDGGGDMGAPTTEPGDGPSMGGEEDGGHEHGDDPISMPVTAILHICRRGDGRGDATGLYWHLVSVDPDGVETDDTPSTTTCTEEHKILEPNPPLPKGHVNDKGVQVKQAVTECRTGTRHVVTYDLTVSPRKEIGDKDTGQAC